MTNQNELQAVIDRAKADIARKYVYVMMPIPQLETLIAGLADAQEETDKWKAEAELQRLLFTDEYETALRYMRERDEARKFVEELETLIIKAKDDIRAGAAGFAAVDIVRYFNQKELTHENQ